MLGFPTLAAYVLDDQMAEDAGRGDQAAHRSGAGGHGQGPRRGGRDAGADRRAARGTLALAPWDWQYYPSRCARREYALDESQIKPYFELDRVLTDGVFYAANQLYGLTFKERKDMPVYQSDVRVFEVFDADGTSMGLFYCDYFKRDNKQGGAWEGHLRGWDRPAGHQAGVYNVANFTKPAAGQPALLSFDDVTTLFHEFGHACTRCSPPRAVPAVGWPPKYRPTSSSSRRSSTSIGPVPNGVRHYARHYQTGQPMPRGGATATWAGSVINGSSHHNRIHHCWFSNYGYYTDDDVSCVLDIGNEEEAADETRYNLVEEGVFHGGHHVVGVYGKYNVIRNNYFHNEPSSMGTTAADRGPFYGDRNLSFSGYSQNGGRNLFEEEQGRLVLGPFRTT